MLRTKPSYWYGRFAFGVALLLLAGFGRVAGPIALSLGVVGFVLALKSVTAQLQLSGPFDHQQ